MTQVSSEQRLPVFYEAQGTDNAEAERLQLMAQHADQVSLDAMHDALTRPNAVCIDIGAGDSTSLGKRVIGQSESATYLPIDIRDEAVAAQRSAGFNAQVGFATDLPFSDNSADILHSRFTFGWLDDDGRNRAFEEMLRVSKAEANLVVIDYDWSTAHGPESYNKLAGYVTGLMSSFGFDPYYGAQVGEDTSKYLAKYGYMGEHVVVDEVRTILQDNMYGALPVINATVLPVLAKLRHAGLQTEAETLASLLSDVQRHASEDPEEMINFPDIVSVSVKISEQALHEAAVNQIANARAVGVEMMRNEAMVSVGPRELDTYRLFNGMITQARKLHAAAYQRYNYITEGAIQNGILIDAIDSQEIVDSSTYLGTPNREGTLDGSIRIIHPRDERLTSLPTVAKIQEVLGEDNPILQELPFMYEGARVFEASALGKSAQCKDKMILSKLLLAAMTEGIEAGYDYAVMGIVKSTARLLTAAYGTEAFQRIDGEAAVVNLTGEGIREDGVELVPFYVKLDTFIDNCKTHFAKNSDSQFAIDNVKLFDAAQEYISKVR